MIMIRDLSLYRMKNISQKRILLSALAVAVGGVVIWSLQRESNVEKFVRGGAQEAQFAEEGKLLAQCYCVQCHTLPDPAWLDKETWVQSALPSMGNYFGVVEHQGMFGHYRVRRESDLLERDALRARIGMADEQMLSAVDWEKILCYFHYNAPKQLESKVLPIDGTLDFFESVEMKHPAMRGMEPQTCCVKILEDEKVIAVSSMNSPTLRFYDAQMKLTGAAQNLPGVCAVERSGEGSLLLTQIGEFKPTEKKLGKLVEFKGSVKSLAVDLARPVLAKAFDANGDAYTDYVICEYGHHTGSLSWLKGGEEGVQKQIILSQANPISVEPIDADGDEDCDLFTLFAGGKEGIWLFTNDGEGEFRGEELISFPAPTGSASMQVLDFDADGDLDLIHVAGDNNDTSRILKPYHGVRIYLNNGDGEFELAYHHLIHGAYKAELADFDLDGDLDIAVCAHYPDYLQCPEQAFVMLENLGAMKFSVKTHKATHGVRWSVMDAADVDGDGDTDIVLGAMIIKEQWLTPHVEILNRWKAAPEVLLLVNKTK